MTWAFLDRFVEIHPYVCVGVTLSVMKHLQPSDAIWTLYDLSFPTLGSFSNNRSKSCLTSRWFSLALRRNPSQSSQSSTFDMPHSKVRNMACEKPVRNIFNKALTDAWLIFIKLIALSESALWNGGLQTTGFNIEHECVDVCFILQLVPQQAGALIGVLLIQDSLEPQTNFVLSSGALALWICIHLLSEAACARVFNDRWPGRSSTCIPRGTASSRTAACCVS